MKKLIILLLFCQFSFGQYNLFARQNFVKNASANLWDGLVSLYKLDETSGTTAYDSFGSSHLTNSGVSINQPGKLGTSYADTSTNQNLSAAGLTTITNDFTINVWCYQTVASTSGNNTIVEMGDYSNGFGIWVNASNYITFFVNSYYDRGSAAAISLPLNAWSMLTFTRKGSEFKLYKDGVLFFSENYVYSLNTATTRRMFNRTSNSEAYRGRLDNVSFFNKALNQAQITAHYNSGNGITL